MKNSARIVLLFIGDIAVLIGSFFLMLTIAFPGLVNIQLSNHLFPFALLGIIWLFIFFIFDLYNTQFVKPTIPHLRRLALAFIVATSASVLLFYAVPSFGITPRTNLALFVVFAVVLFFIWRRIFYEIFSSYFKKSVSFIVSNATDQKRAKDLATYIQTYPQSGFVITGTYASVQQFLQSSHEADSHACIISKEILRDSQDLKQLYINKCEIIDLAYAYEDILGRIPIDAIDDVWFLHNIRSTNKNLYDFGKRIWSIGISLLVLIIFSPFIAIAALLIKLYDKGPIVYSQKRIGKNNTPFKLYKLRSMIVSAETNGAQWADKKDVRVTPIGKVLRTLHIDELPQLWNVIRGDIALVGPRPERPRFVEQLEKEIPYYQLRHIITPGFTGWAQIKFRYARSVMDTKEKFEYDLFYLKNRNVFMDVGILLRTVQVIFTH